MYKYLTGLTIAAFFVACAQAPQRQYRYSEAGAPAAERGSESKRKNMNLDDVDIVGWLDNPSAAFVLDDQAEQSDTYESQPKPTEILMLQLVQSRDLEAMVNQKIGQTDQEIQSLRVIGETGRLDIKPKWPGVAPLKTDTLLLNLGSKLVASTEHFRSYKVPAGKLDSAMKLITLLGDVRYEQIIGEDLSLEMGGVERRLVQLKLLETKYKGLLSKVKEDEKAKVLKLLERVVQDLQVLTQRQKLLKEKSQWATLQVNFIVNAYPYRNHMPQAISWIGEITPWGTYLQPEHDAFEIELVKPFIEVEVPLDNHWNPRVFRATLGNGSSVRAWKDASLPVADEVFWNQALNLNLRKSYEEVQCEIKGSSSKWNWCAFRMNKKDHRWSYLALKPKSIDSDDTKIVQIDFPSQELKEQFLSSWVASVKKAMEE